jgi:uncharacterized membrane protein YoaK (UPF0700 family)
LAEIANKVHRVASSENEKMWLALLLAWIAGFADAFGFLTLKDIFFSAVSGNTVAVNAALARSDWNEVVRHGCPIIFFVGGLVVGSIIEKLACRLRIRRRFSVALAIEGTLLLLLALLGRSLENSDGGFREGTVPFYLFIVLLSGAMGIQTASLRRVRHDSVNTPFVTGMLVRSVEHAIAAVFNAYDRLAKRKPEFPNDSMAVAVFHGALWLCFAIGAFCGGVGEVRWSFSALFAPLAVLVFVIACDLARPISD